MNGAYGGLIMIVMYSSYPSTPVIENFFLQTDLTPILQTDNTPILLTD